LTVAGEARRFCSRKEGRCTVRGRSYGKFSRTLKLPFATKVNGMMIFDTVRLWDADTLPDVKAKMKNGVLTVTFPKTNSEQQVQRIAIQ
ncbi:hypothetical protein L210DRAFT_844191, partial [Boletus edulis BED1]